MRLFHSNLVIMQIYGDWNTQRREDLKAGKFKGEFAGPDLSYPIASAADVRDAWNLAGHSNEPTRIRKNVIRIARKFGWESGLPETALKWASENLSSDYLTFLKEGGLDLKTNSSLDSSSEREDTDKKEEKGKDQMKENQNLEEDFSSSESVLELAEPKKVANRFADAAVHRRATAQVKARYAIWPSAYASAALVKTYKQMYQQKHGSLKGAFKYSEDSDGQTFYTLSEDTDGALEKSLEEYAEVFEQASSSDSQELELAETGLTKWFKEKWVRISSSGDIVGECGGAEEREGKPKCLPRSKAESLSPQERRAAVARKRREDPNKERKGEAKMVSTFSEPLNTLIELMEEIDRPVMTVPVAVIGKWVHPEYGQIEFTQQDFEDIIRNVDQKTLGYEPYLTVGHQKEPDSKPSIAFLTEVYQEGEVLYGEFEVVDEETYSQVVRGQYRYSSPEILRNTQSKETGDAVGTVLVGAALTNRPFLTRMPKVEAHSNLLAGVEYQTFSLPYPFASDRMKALASTYRKLVNSSLDYGRSIREQGPEKFQYVDTANNPFLLDGMMCANCAFYEGGSACMLVPGSIEEGGYCKLWLLDKDDSDFNAANPLPTKESDESLEEDQSLSEAIQDLLLLSESDFEETLEHFAEWVYQEELSDTPSLRKEHKDPKGGLTRKGISYYNRKTGSNLKPGVMGKADTPEKMRRKGSFLTRFYTNLSGPLVKNGKPTRLALAAAAWGEPVPRTAKSAARLAAKGRALLKRYESMKKQKASIFGEAPYQILSTNMLRIPLAKKGRWHHDSYGVVEFTDKDFNDIIQNFSDDVLGFEPYSTYGHPLDPDAQSIDAERKKGELKRLQVKGDILYGDFTANDETYQLVTSGEYDYNSPEVIRNFTDKSTGKNRGTVLVRTALTNAPFIPFKTKVQALSLIASDCPQRELSYVIHLQSDGSLPTDNPDMSELTTPQKTIEESGSEVNPAQGNSSTSAVDTLVDKFNQELLSLKSQLTEYHQELGSLKNENSELKDQLQKTISNQQVFSNTFSQQEERYILDQMTKAGVSPAFIQRFSTLKRKLVELNASNELIQLSTQSGQTENRTVVNELAYLLVEAIHANPETQVVHTEQFGNSVRPSDPTGLQGRIKQMASDLRASAQSKTVTP